MEKLLYAGTYVVGSMKAKMLEAISTQPIDKFQDIPMFPGTKVYESVVELCGKSCRALVSYSESFFTKQLAALTATMSKCQEKLKALQNHLSAWTGEKKPKGPRPTKAKVKKRIKKILSSQHMENIFTIALAEIDGLPYLRYKVNREELDRLTSICLGRTLLITNRCDWLPTEIISAYRDLANIEEAFKHMKNRDYLRWQPAFHWTDQKIKVHTFYCVLALLLATLARKIAWEADHEISLPALLDNLSAMKEVVILYPEKGNKLKAQFTMNRMTSLQKKLAELFEIGEILAAG